MDEKRRDVSPIEGGAYLSLTEVDGQMVYERSDALRWRAEQDIIEARYAYAMRCLRRIRARQVLDLGCGLGYGTWLLDRAGFDVLGVDLSAEALHVARARYPWIRFQQADISVSPLSTVDAVIGCEVIEHLLEPRPFLSAVRDLLKPGGIFVVSTPHHKYTVDSSNLFHEHEYTIDELRYTLGGAEVRSLDTRLLKPARLWIAILGTERFMRLKYRLTRSFPFHQWPQFSRTLLACTTREQLAAVLGDSR